MNDDTMTAAEVADKLRVNVATIYKRCKTGEWQATKIGRIYRFTPEQYANNTEPPAPQQKPRNQRQNINKLLRTTK